MNILSIHARPGGKRTMPAPLGRGGNRVSDMAPPTSLQPGPQPSTVGEYAVMLCCRHSFAVYTEKGPVGVAVAAAVTTKQMFSIAWKKREVKRVMRRM